MLTMCPRQIARFVIAALVVAGGLLCAPSPIASADCSDVEVVFARGTGEPPGVGGIGEPFVDALRSAVGAKSLNVYPVNYEASSDFSDRIQFAQSVVDGIKMLAVISSRPRRAAPTPGLCSADIPRARSSPVSPPRLPYPREYRPITYSSCPSHCRRRWLSTSPR